MKPFFSTIFGGPEERRVPRTRSARLPTSTEPTSCAMPCVIAGLIVYLAM
jgi:hypothetical protein